MLRIKIERRWPKDDYTIGRVLINGRVVCNSLEDTDRKLNAGMSESEIRKIKVYGKTAIPKGSYRVYLRVSPKFKERYWAKKYGGMVPYISGVKGFEGCLIHVGNRAEDTDGCILVGMNTAKGRLTQSAETFYTLMDKYIWPEFQREDGSVYLDIV